MPLAPYPCLIPKEKIPYLVESETSLASLAQSKNTKDEVSSSYGGKVMNGQSCRFWPFGAVDCREYRLTGSALLSGRLGGGTKGLSSKDLGAITTIMEAQIYGTYLPHPLL